MQRVPISLVLLLVYCLLNSSLVRCDEEPPTCRVSGLPMTRRPQTTVVRHFSGYNENVALPTYSPQQFNDTGVQETLMQLPVGGSRFPGGTPANYFNLSRANTISPCTLANVISAEVAKGICPDEKHIDQWAPGTLSVANYYKYISSSMIAGPATTVWVLNLMLLDGADLYGQVDTLIEAIPNTADIQYIELGNEYYLKDYVHVFPNASSYMEKAVPLARYIQTKLPNAKISFVCEYEAPWTPQSAEWNQAIVSNSRNYPVEYVTVHDYSMGYHSAGKVPPANLTEIALWGEVSVPHIVASIEQAFTAGSNATDPPKVFISEFGLAPQFDKALGVSAMKAIFTFNYQMAGFCNSTGQTTASGVELTFLHVLWGGISWTENWVTALLGDEPNTAPSYSAASQALAQPLLTTKVKAWLEPLSLRRRSPLRHWIPSREPTLTGVPQPFADDVIESNAKHSASSKRCTPARARCDEGIFATVLLPSTSSESRNGTHTVYHSWYRFQGESGFVPFPVNCSGELWAPSCDRSQWGNWEVAPQSIVHLKSSAKAVDFEFPPFTLSITEFPL
jgi:hypothetical protein